MPWPDGRAFDLYCWPPCPLSEQPPRARTHHALVSNQGVDGRRPWLELDERRLSARPRSQAHFLTGVHEAPSSEQPAVKTGNPSPRGSQFLVEVREPPLE